MMQATSTLNQTAPGVACSTTALPVMEQFLSLQGEGRHSGQVAYFIRLAGCDVGCVWCDVKESWKADLHPVRKVNDLVEDAVQSGSPHVVITGGEPSMHDLSVLTRQLRSAGLKVWLETAGVYPLQGEFDWVCLSPKKFKAPLSQCLAKANEFKVVVYHPSDLQWACGFLGQLPPDCLLYVQPEWDNRHRISPLLVRYIQKNPRWQLSLQTHKYLEIP
jgi:organic radical activating enzyme